MQKLFQKIKVWYDKIKIAETSYGISHISPSRDWKILLITTIVLMCIITVSSFYFYIKLDNGEIFNVSSSKKDRELKIDEKSLKQAIDDINLREENFKEAKDNKSVPPDPSI